MQCEIWFNPSCSKCNAALDLIEEEGHDPTVVRYLDTPPTREDLERVLHLLGFDDPRLLMRTDEPVYAGLEEASPAELLDAMVRHPVLIQRPVVIAGGKAVIGRPPERVLDILSPKDGEGPLRNEA